MENKPKDESKLRLISMSSAIAFILAGSAGDDVEFWAKINPEEMSLDMLVGMYQAGEVIATEGKIVV